MVATHTQDNKVKASAQLSNLNIGWVSVLVVILLLVFSKFSASILPVRHLLLDGKFQYTEPKELQSVLDQFSGSGLLTVDLLKMQSELEQFPWVRSVDIERVWPDRIRVNIIEKNPYLRLGSDKIISVDGIVFSPESTHNFSELPLLDINRVFTPELFQAYREMEYLLANTGYELKQFQVNKQGEWTLDLANNIHIALGRNNPLSSFKRFVAILPHLGNDRINKLKSIDLRYENGFAIGYK